MAKRVNAKKAEKATNSRSSSGPFRLRDAEAAGHDRERFVHVYGDGVVCDTERRGYPTSRGLSPLEIVVDASEGFIPLWAKGITLRWRFQERSMSSFQNPAAAKAEIRKLLGEAVLAWGSSAPVKFSEREHAWDFEIVISKADDCDVNGCVLASAFFPDAGRHELTLYPEMFHQSRREQVETLIHEIGHVFGLRHFFAQVTEKAWPSEVFGTHKPFSIMNYGSQSALTKDDKADLKRLYETAWSGELTEINGTPIHLVKSFSSTRACLDAGVPVLRAEPVTVAA